MIVDGKHVDDGERCEHGFPKPCPQCDPYRFAALLGDALSAGEVPVRVVEFEHPCPIACPRCAMAFASSVYHGRRTMIVSRRLWYTLVVSSFVAALFSWGRLLWVVLV